MPKVHILETFCKGCGLCVAACQRGRLHLSQRVNARGYRVACPLEDGGCTGCLRCALMCPDAAIEITEDESPAPPPRAGRTPADRRTGPGASSHVP